MEFRTAVLGPGGGALQGETCVFGVEGTAGDDGGRPGIVRDGRGQYGTVVRNTGMGGTQGMIIGTGMGGIQGMIIGMGMVE